MMTKFLRGQIWKQVWILEARGPFLESPSNFSGPKASRKEEKLIV